MEATAPESAATRRVVHALSVFVFVAVAVVLYAFPGRTAPHSPGVLPTINALLNGSAGVFLVLGFVFIKKRQMRAHRACMLVAFGLSSAFLVTYLLHHAQVGSVKYQGVGAIRTLYFAMLIPHVILAGVVVPLALFTIYRGWTGRFPAHKKIAKITLPLWLYVSVSGVILYFMLYS
ncbi:MAG: DUF420 domain-containing protein [Myxococcales bacterium]|nr:DUF420 domain-containing protein [Myxococcales bacterium]MCB9576109.1 DUF420 domain-containing protein [Polyangiaceae bacterium]